MLTETITYPTAFIAGLLSFFSPCVLPLLPAYFSFITGLSLDELTIDSKETRKKVIISTLVYVTGFSTVFILLGASASYIGGLTQEYAWILRFFGGGVIIIFGLHLLGVINIQTLQFEKKLHVKKKPLHLVGTFFIGMAFAAGWSPCIGPMLASILFLAGGQETVYQGVGLLAIFSAGLAIPFLIISFFIQYILEFMKKTRKFIVILNRTSGVLLIIIGLLLLLGKFNIIAQKLNMLFYN